jgi:hypothetical protein
MTDSDLVVFGDGCQAWFYDERNPQLQVDGTKTQEILIVPSIEMRVKYGLTDDDLPMVTSDGYRGIWMSFPVKQILRLTSSKEGSVILICCSFDRQPTIVTRYYDDMLEWDQERDKTEKRLRAYISTLQAELEDIQTNPPEYIRRIKEMADTATTAKKIDEDEEFD